MHKLVSIIISAFALIATPAVFAQDEKPEKMFVVTRYHVENVRDLLTDELNRGHEDHIEKYSKSVTSANILDEDGKTIGVTSIKGFSSREEVEFYVYEDPFTKANFYKEIEILAIDLYVLNAEYACVPDWVLERNPEEKYKYTPPTKDGCAPTSDD